MKGRESKMQQKSKSILVHGLHLKLQINLFVDSFFVSSAVQVGLLIISSLLG